MADDGERFIGRNSWNDAIGVVVDELRDDLVRAHVEAGPRHQQPYGVLHGGAWCSIVEEVASIGAGTLARKRSGAGVLGVSNHTDFLRSHSIGRLEATGRPLHVGRRQHLWEVLVHRASDGVLVARGQVRFQVLDELPGARAERMSDERARGPGGGASGGAER